MVAKRKMNNHSFFGSFLKVSYAPEYEDVEDTRQKLIARGKAVARRLRQLGSRGKEDKPVPSNTPSSGITEQNQTIPGQGCSASSGSMLPSGHMTGPPERGTTSSFPALPLPPTVLPHAEWKNPACVHDISIPSVPSARATLPEEFNPYIDHTNSSSDNDDTEKKTDNLGQTFPMTYRNSQIRSNMNESGNFGKKGGSIFLRTKPQDRDLPGSSPWVVTGKRRLDSSQQPQGASSPRDGARPKVVPRRRFAWTNERTRNAAIESSERQQFLGQRLNPAPLPTRNPAGNVDGELRQPREIPRQIRQGLNRRAETHLQADSGFCDSNTPSSSFDQSVSSIRERMRQVQNPSTSSGHPHLQQSHADVHSPQLPAPQRPSDGNPHTHLSTLGSSDVSSTDQISSNVQRQRRVDPSKRRRI